MDLFTAEKTNGRPGTLAKHVAFMCFLVACGLLGASLVLSQSGGVGNGHGYAARTVSSAP